VILKRPAFPDPTRMITALEHSDSHENLYIIQ
jgi:hypothetical protein